MAFFFRVVKQTTKWANNYSLRGNNIDQITRANQIYNLKDLRFLIVN
jgi:hypothetical protein